VHATAPRSMKTHDSRRHWPLSGMLRPRIDRPVMADGSVRHEWCNDRDRSGSMLTARSAIGLEPKTAALWSDRGYACLRLHDYKDALSDEAKAIQLDTKLARAYFLRGAAFGALGDSHSSVSDIVTALRLDPSLERYVTFKGEDASITLPP